MVCQQNYAIDAFPICNAIEMEMRMRVNNAIFWSLIVLGFPVIGKVAIRHFKLKHEGKGRQAYL